MQKIFYNSLCSPYESYFLSNYYVCMEALCMGFSNKVVILLLPLLHMLFVVVKMSIIVKGCIENLYKIFNLIIDYACISRFSYSYFFLILFYYQQYTCIKQTWIFVRGFYFVYFANFIDLFKINFFIKY